VNDSNQSGETAPDTLLGESAFSGKVAPGVSAVTAKGGQRPYSGVTERVKPPLCVLSRE